MGGATTVLMAFRTTQYPYAMNNFSSGTANNLSAEQYGDAGRSMRYPASVLNQSRRYPPKYSGYTMTTRTTGHPSGLSCCEAIVPPRIGHSDALMDGDPHTFYNNLAAQTIHARATKLLPRDKITRSTCVSYPSPKQCTVEVCQLNQLLGVLPLQLQDGRWSVSLVDLGQMLQVSDQVKFEANCEQLHQSVCGKVMLGQVPVLCSVGLVHAPPKAHGTVRQWQAFFSSFEYNTIITQHRLLQPDWHQGLIKKASQRYHTCEGLRATTQ